jgi:uncharacterized membrane protein (GlpM family)
VADAVVRFLVGGVAVSCFAALADVLRPKSFAGLFGAAPAVALATLTLTVSERGASFAAREGLSMMAGAAALIAYCSVVCLLLQRWRWHAKTAALLGLVLWLAVAFGIAGGVGLL